jgi:hypothetical protein
LNQSRSNFSFSHLSIWEQAGISILLLVILIYGIFVECRATLTSNHNTDLGVYLAAAQAVRENGDLYSASYNLDHYMYPPFLALLLAHVVPSPAQSGQPVTVAFAATVSLWYILSVVALAVAVGVLARTLSAAWPESWWRRPVAWRPFWTVCLLPVFVCLHSLGRELQLGQVDVFMLLLMAMMMVCAAEGRSGQAGLWHAFAICLKVMPVALLIYPLWRRDWRWLLACTGGLVAGLVILPLLTFGYTGAVNHTRAYVQALVLPAITGKTTDHSRDGEMFNQDAVHNFSIVGVMHSLENISQDRHERPKIASALNRQVAAGLGVLLMLLTMLASGFQRRLSRHGTVLCLSMLMVVVAIGSPVCQSYYFVLLIPLLAAIIAADLQRSGRVLPRPLILMLCALFALAQAVSSFFPLVRDCGVVLAAILMLWLVALKVLGREVEATPGKSLSP